MILFLYGEDTFRSNEKLAEIKNKFLINNGSGSDLSIIDFEESKEGKLSDLAYSGGLFSSKRLIVAKNSISGTKADVQEENLKFLQDRKLVENKDIVVIFLENSMPRKNNKFFKFLEKNSKSQKFEKLESGKLASWAEKRILKISPEVSISKEALEKLIIYASDDLFQLDNEIKKLVVFKEKGIIEEKDVDILVKSKTESNIFETVEALSQGNKKIALKLLHNQIESGEDPFYIFSMYVYQFRNLLKISEFFQEGMSNQYQIAKETGLHPFVVQKGLGQLRNTTSQKLSKIYLKLKEIDVGVKTGKSDIMLALDKLVAEL